LNEPLAGVQVLDLTRLFPFSYGSQFLVDLGAEVTKIEQPGGEVGRAQTDYYRASNRGKRSVTLDLRQAADRERFTGLLINADVVIENFRPGFLNNLGLGYAFIRSVRPEIVMCSISGYGPDGLMRHAPGHDLNYYAISGAALPSSDRSPQLPAIPVVDVTVGMHLAYCVAAALFSVACGRPGGHIEISMSDVALSLNTLGLSRLGDQQVRPEPSPGVALHEAPCYRLWKTLDGRWVALCNVEKKFWVEFLEVVKRPDFVADQFSTGPRGRHVTESLAEILASRTSEDWERAFANREVCFSPVLTSEEVLAYPEFAGRKILRRLDGGVEVLLPAVFNGVRPTRPEWLAEPGADDSGPAAQPLA
jgi:crotonobetainyl-CoA:carnitine CoA-transferase CaiB-like acyl-CoA transferase